MSSRMSLIVCVALVCAFALQPITVQAFTVTGYTRIFEGIATASGSCSSPLEKAFAVRIDLHNPSVRMYASHDNGGSPYETTRQTPQAFLVEHGLKAAVNANFFNMGLSPDTDNSGLVISNGTLVSPAEGGTFSGQLGFTSSNVASMVWSPNNPSGIYNAVGCAEQLLSNGAIVVGPGAVDEHTGMGLSADGRYLFMVVVDGRRDGWSGGCNYQEMAQWLLDFGAYSVAGMFDGGGSSCLCVSNGAGGATILNWPTETRAVGTNLGASSQPVLSFNAKPVLFRAANNWLLRNTLSGGSADSSFAFGTSGDTPIMGDWDGNGSITCGVVRLVNGQWEWRLKNSNSAGTADLIFVYGVTGDIPIVGDWDGDRVWTVGVTRGNEWLLRNSNSPGGADLDFSYGTTGDVLVTGDWDGDGTFTPGIKRGSNTWLLRNSNSTGGADIPSFGFGTTGDKPIVGDWDGNGTWTIGMIRGSNSWLCRNSNSTGSADVTFAYGTTGDKMLVWH